MRGLDTCYIEIRRPDPSASILPQLQATPKPGEGVVDTVWSLVDHSSCFSLGSCRYSRYDTSSAGATSFFPAGSVESVNKFSLGKCDSRNSLEVFVKQLLAKDFDAHPIPERTTANLTTTAESYYKNLFAVSCARRVTVFGTGKAAISFAVNSSGNVDRAVHSKSSPWNMKLDKALNEEVQTWKFPPCPSQTGNVYARIQFTY
jgi:TonB family protein